jgi:hypothetical protein
MIFDVGNQEIEERPSPQLMQILGRPCPDASQCIGNLSVCTIFAATGLQ